MEEAVEGGLEEACGKLEESGEKVEERRSEGVAKACGKQAAVNGWGELACGR